MSWPEGEKTQLGSVLALALLLFSPSVVMPASGEDYPASYWLDKAEEHYEKGENASWDEREGYYKFALVCVDKSLEIDPENAYAWNVKGSNLLGLNKNREALECFETATRINPLLSEAWVNKAEAHRWLGEHEKTVECFDMAIKCCESLDDSREKAEALLETGNSLLATGDSLIRLGGEYEKAAECFDMVIKCYESLDDSREKSEALLETGNSFRVRGDSYRRFRKYEEAAEFYDLAIKFYKSLDDSREKSEALLETGNSTRETGDYFRSIGEYEEAIECYDMAIECYESLDYSLEKAGALREKAGALEALGEHWTAFECYDSAIELGLSDEELLRNRAHALKALSWRGIFIEHKLTASAGISILLIIFTRRLWFPRAKEWLSSRRSRKIRPPISGDVKQALDSFQPVKNRALHIILRYLPVFILIEAVFVIKVRDFVLLPWMLAALIIYLGFWPIMRRIPTALGTLWDLNIIAAKSTNDSNYTNPIEETHESATPPKSSTSPEKEYLTFIGEYQASLNHRAQWVMAVFFALGWWIAMIAIQESFMPDKFSFYGFMELFQYHIIFEFFIGFVVGIMAWRMLVTGRQIWRLGKMFDLNPQLGHPDKCGGLEPLGNLCLWNALILFIPGIYLGGLIWIAATMIYEYYGYHKLPEICSYPAECFILGLMPIIVAMISFVLPQWRVHQVMASKRAARWQELSQQFEGINRMAREILDRGDNLEREEAEPMFKRLELMQRTYLDQKSLSYPTWPFSLKIMAKFVTILPILTILTQLIIQIMNVQKGP